MSKSKNRSKNRSKSRNRLVFISTLYKKRTLPFFVRFSMLL